MAKTLHGIPREALVGKNVYPPCSPYKAGRIVEVLEDREMKHKVEVKYVNGTQEVTWTTYLNDFDTLIADHRKRLATHEATLDTLAKLDLLMAGLTG
jgi:hypothetical protein